MSATREYDAWGNVYASTGTHVGRFGYGGGFGYQEEDSGLKLLGHRFYDPQAGRFLTRDRIKDGRNWYVDCENNPIRNADPSGLQVSIDSIRANIKTYYELMRDGVMTAGKYLKNLIPQIQNYFFKEFGIKLNPHTIERALERLDDILDLLDIIENGLVYWDIKETVYNIVDKRTGMVIIVSKDGITVTVVDKVDRNGNRRIKGRRPVAKDDVYKGFGWGLDRIRDALNKRKRGLF